MIPQPTNPQFEHEARSLEREREVAHEKQESMFERPHEREKAQRRWWQFWRQANK